MIVQFIYFLKSKTARQLDIKERNFFLNTLNDARAWPIVWIETRNPYQSNWNVVLETQDFIDSTYPSTIKGLSVTEFGSITATGTKAPMTVFSAKNWTTVPKELRGKYNIHEYRTYVIMHECGHAIGLGHQTCKSGPAPIMLQQTRGLKHCTKNLWPLEEEIAKAFRGM
jgi:hypothetical protein